MNDAFKENIVKHFRGLIEEHFDMAVEEFINKTKKEILLKKDSMMGHMITQISSNMQVTTDRLVFNFKFDEIKQ